MLNRVYFMMFFKKVKLIFWADAVLFEVYIENMFPYNVTKKESLEM